MHFAPTKTQQAQHTRANSLTHGPPHLLEPEVVLALEVVGLVDVLLVLAVLHVRGVQDLVVAVLAQTQCTKTRTTSRGEGSCAYKTPLWNNIFLCVGRLYSNSRPVTYTRQTTKTKHDTNTGGRARTKAASQLQASLDQMAHTVCFQINTK